MYGYKKIKWGTSNYFSEGHRKYLPSNFCMFDVDGILLDEERNPKFLYEEKYKMIFGEDRVDFIKTFYHTENTQAFFLRNISEKIGVYIHEKTTGKWWFLKDRTLNSCDNPHLDLIKTDNRIYIEDIISGYNQKISGIFIRTEGEKPCQMETYGDFLSDLFNAPKVLVNDVFESDYIHFKINENVLKCSVNSRWEDTWKKLEII
jgi:hypothetical protein